MQYNKVEICGVNTSSLPLLSEQEKDDLLKYVNLFGYNPKYGIEGKAIGSVTYKPQPYNPRKPLYEA